MKFISTLVVHISHKRRLYRAAKGTEEDVESFNNNGNDAFEHLYKIYKTVWCTFFPIVKLYTHDWMAQKNHLLPKGLRALLKGVLSNTKYGVH